MLENISYNTFLEAFQAIRKPDLIHDFKKHNENITNPQVSNVDYEHLQEQLTKQLDEKKKIEQELMTQLSQKDKALQEILNSNAWKLVMALRRARSWLPLRKS